MKIRFNHLKNRAFQRVLSVFTLLLIVCFSACAIAQSSRNRNRGQRMGGEPIVTQRGNVPMWDVNPNFKKDVFTFVRVKYESHNYGRSRGSWSTDYYEENDAPSEVNFSFRLQELTSMAVEPTPIVLELTDPRLFDYPFIYIVEPGRLEFQEPEVLALRRFCLNGGFLLVDDFWGDEEYENFHHEIKRVFPDREPTEVPIEHEIFHMVYDIKEKPQLPSIGGGNWRRGVTWEYRAGSDTSYAQYKSITDNSGRIMVFICHNTDLGDGWEREGDNIDFFEQMSVKKAYPMGINIVLYAMTH